MEIYNTTWWGNAIDTAITAGTEPDFFGSQMKMLTSQQPEEVINGDFATDSDWSKGTGWTISEGKASFNTTTNGSLTQSGFANSKIYKVSIDVVSYVRGNPFIAIGQGSQHTLPTSVGTHIIYITSGTVDTVLRIYSGQFGIGGQGSIDNISIKLARAEEVEAVKCLADWIHTTALQDLNN